MYTWLRGVSLQSLPTSPGPKGPSSRWRAAWKWAPGGNDSVSPLGDNPTYRTWLLICYRKWMLNLVER